MLGLFIELNFPFSTHSIVKFFRVRYRAHQVKSLKKQWCSFSTAVRSPSIYSSSSLNVL